MAGVTLQTWGTKDPTRNYNKIRKQRYIKNKRKNVSPWIGMKTTKRRGEDDANVLGLGEGQECCTLAGGSVTGTVGGPPEAIPIQSLVHRLGL